MARYANDKDVKDAARVRARVETLHKNIVSIRDKMWDILTVKEDADLFEMQQIAERILNKGD